MDVANPGHPVIVVHGGAGDLSRMAGARLAGYREGLRSAANAGWEVLVTGRSALDAVEASTRSMEAAGHFNAGIGSALTLEGRIEMDAAIMDGETLLSGAVGAVAGIAHPITLARHIMERTDHALFVGEGAERLARTFQLAPLMGAPTPHRQEQHRRLLARLEEEGDGRGRYGRLRQLLSVHPDLVGDTVGAVALDASGGLAASVSTGGLSLKLAGRVGDSALVGAGLYAERGVAAASATGIGEAILRATLCREACRLVEEGRDLQQAARRALERMARFFGPETGGLILVDATGRIALHCNTNGMGRAYRRAGMAEAAVAVMADEVLG